MHKHMQSSAHTAGTCMHWDMQSAVHMGEGGQMFQPSGPRDPGCARCLTPGISLEGCRGSPQPAVQEAEGGAGSYPGLLPRRRLGPRAGRGRVRLARLELFPL